MNAKKFFTLLVLAAASLKGYSQVDSRVQSNEEAARPVVKRYDKLISLSPIQFTENGFGLAIGFEQDIDKAGIVAYNLPLVATFNMSRNDYYGNASAAPMYYFMPGLKFYPTGSHGKVKYAIGPSVVAGIGKTSEYNSYMPYDKQRDKFLLGVIINNSMNINVTKNIYMGMELGFGFTYIRQYDGVRQNMGGLAQGGFKMGYRF